MTTEVYPTTLFRTVYMVLPLTLCNDRAARVGNDSPASQHTHTMSSHGRPPSQKLPSHLLTYHASQVIPPAPSLIPMLRTTHGPLHGRGRPGHCELVFSRGVVTPSRSYSCAASPLLFPDYSPPPQGITNYSAERAGLWYVV